MKKAMGAGLLSSSMLALVLCTGCASTGAQPLSENITLPTLYGCEATTNDPQDVRQLTGSKWLFRWYSGKAGGASYVGRDAKLAIECIYPKDKKAKVLYAWGTDGRDSGGYNRVLADYIAGDEPVIKWGGGETASKQFTLKNGVLHGWWWNAITYTATGTKIP